MWKRETPEIVAERRVVRASAILDRTIDLRGYPYRHLAVQAAGGLGLRPLTTAMTVADVLEPLGWELVNVAVLNNLTYAFYRRR